MVEIASKKTKGLCVANRCQNPNQTKDRFCPKHRKRYQKEHNLLGYTFDALKQNAKRRGKVFELTRDDFRKFCEKTNYLILKGKSATSASIDRIDPTKGYVPGNIQLLSIYDNSKKQHGYDKSKQCPF